MTTDQDNATEEPRAQPTPHMVESVSAASVSITASCSLIHGVRVIVLRILRLVVTTPSQKMTGSTRHDKSKKKKKKNKKKKKSQG